MSWCGACAWICVHILGTEVARNHSDPSCEWLTHCHICFFFFFNSFHSIWKKVGGGHWLRPNQFISRSAKGLCLVWKNKQKHCSGWSTPFSVHVCVHWFSFSDTWLEGRVDKSIKEPPSTTPRGWVDHPAGCSSALLDELLIAVPVRRVLQSCLEDRNLLPRRHF